MFNRHLQCAEHQVIGIQQRINQVLFSQGISRVSASQPRAPVFCQASKTAMSLSRQSRERCLQSWNPLFTKKTCLRMQTESLLREICSSISSYQVLLSFLNSFSFCWNSLSLSQSWALYFALPPHWYNSTLIFKILCPTDLYYKIRFYICVQSCGWENCDNRFSLLCSDFS